jgi:hypothetical protein
LERFRRAAWKEAQMGAREIPDELIDQLLGECQGPEQLTVRMG